MEERIKKLERQVKALAGLSVMLLLGGILVLISNQPVSSEGGILRVKGIVVEDSAGRERILIGAPVPKAANRVRTDTARVREIWGQRFSKRYMEWYANYNHSANGIIILDENGFDRIAIGNPTPDPNIGQRIGPATGIEINDEEGFERSGYGILSVGGSNRVVLGLDGKNGTEAVTLSVDDSDGSAGLSVNRGQNLIYLGHANASTLKPEGGKNFSGMILKDSVNLRFFEIQPEKIKK